MIMQPECTPIPYTCQAARRPKRSLAAAIKRLRVMPAVFETALMPSDMALAGARLYSLHGDRAGQWSVSISGNWRVVFGFEGRNVANVDLVNYH